MKTFKSICIGCGQEIEFEYYAMGEIVGEKGYEITHIDDVGWWGFECPECGRCVDCDLVELIVEGDLEGFGTCVETASEVRNLIKAVMKWNPALIAEIRNELEGE